MRHTGQVAIGPSGRRLVWAITTAVIVVVLLPLFPPSARGCSCAGGGDLVARIDQSEMAMVGTLVARTDGGLGGLGGSGAIYTYQVDDWVKGDAGDVIEVHSGQGDGDCGMGGEIGDQIGAFLYDGGGFISGNSCDQVDPEALLAAARGPVPSTTGIGRLLSGNGWSSTRLSVLDEVGGTVTQLDAGRGEQWEGTQGLEICPGGALMLQWTQTIVHVWDLETLTTTASHPVSGPDGYPVVWDVSCRDPEASSIWVVGASEFDNDVFDVVDGTVLLSGVAAEWASLGSDS